MRSAFSLALVLSTCLAPAALAIIVGHPDYDAQLDDGAHGRYPTRKLISSDLEHPRINIPIWTPECDDGLYQFIAPRGWSVSKPGPMILDAQGQVIWSQHFSNQFGGQAYDLKVQEYKGEKFLTFWLGDDRIRGHGFGHYVMLNSSYDIVRKVGSANGAPADLHEFLITPQGTALVIVYNVIVGDITPISRKLHSTIFGVSYVWENSIQEISLETGELLFDWRAYEHINITNTYRDVLDMGAQASPFDWFHINSVAKDELGNYLICVRYTHAIYYINGKTKEVIWTLGGKENSFLDLSGGSALNFAWQHDARFVSPSAFPETYTAPKVPRGQTVTLMTLFDNSGEDWNYAYGPSRSRGMLLELTYPTPGKDSRAPERPSSPSDRNSTLSTNLSPIDAEKVASINGSDPAYTVRLIQEFIPLEPIRSSSQGSLQLLPQGKRKDPRVYIGFGLAAGMTEFTSNGSVLCNTHFGSKTSWEGGYVQSYRAYKFPWIGRPREPPAVGVKGNEVFVSWNGATEVSQWKIEASTSLEGANWTHVTVEAYQGFESCMQLPEQHRRARYLRLTALDKKGKALEHGIVLFDHGQLATLLRQHVSSEHPTTAKLVVSVLLSVAGAWVLYVVVRVTCGRRGRLSAGLWNSRARTAEQNEIVEMTGTSNSRHKQV